MIRGGDEFFVWADGRAFVDTHHERDARAVDIAIQQADADTEIGERTGEVHGAGGFADAAFAAGDRDDALDAGNFVLIRKRSLTAAGSLRAGLLADIDMDGVDAGQCPQDAFAFGFDLLRCFGTGGGQFHRNTDGAVAHGNSFDQTKRNNVARETGVFDGFECDLNVIFCRHSV